MPYNQKKQAGRGPKMKTGAGVPSALLQTDPKDEKSGKNVHPGYKKPVYKQPFEGENLTSGQSFANYDAQKDFEGRSKLSASREKTVKFPKKGETFNIGGKGKAIKVSAESIDDKGGISYQNLKTGERGYGTRAALKESIATGYSLGKINEAIKRRSSKK